MHLSSCLCKIDTEKKKKTQEIFFTSRRWQGKGWKAENALALPPFYKDTCDFIRTYIDYPG